MAPTLTIRNLTSTPLELVQCEKYELHATRHLTSFIKRSDPSAVLPDNIESSGTCVQRKAASVRLEAFTTIQSDVPAIEGAQDILRLTFESTEEPLGRQWRYDCRYQSYGCSDLIPLNQAQKGVYTAIYIPESSFIAIFSSVNMQAWMGELRDETPLSGLSIPGTHNAPACHRALPSVRCQAVSPKVQLENGVRFFDIRVQIDKPDDPGDERLILVHSVFPVSLTGPKYFRDLINDVEAFLAANPQETVIMSVKREGTGTGNDAQLSRKLRDHYAGDVNRWYTRPRVPTLGEARKKIVLIRRFGLEDGLNQEWNGEGWCIDASVWADNTPDALCPNGDLRIQDFYEVMETENIDKKIEYCEAHLARAAEAVCALPGIGTQSANPPPEKQPLFINFLTASNFWKQSCWPEKIAAKLNPHIVDFLCRKHNEPAEGAKPGDGCTGIVVCDWVGNKGNWDLVRAIVGMNAKLELREKTEMSGI